MIGPSPAHELVQAAEPGDQLVAGVEEQVERVAEHHVVAERGDLGGQQALDRRLRRERDERRRADVAVRGVQDARAGARARIAGRDVQGAGECGHRGMVEALWCWPASCPSPGTWAIRCCSSSSPIETMGIPVPGETALFTAGDPRVERPSEASSFVIVVAAGAAIVGDNVGFAIGRAVRAPAPARPRAARAPPPPRDRGRRAVLRAPRAEGRVPRPLGRRAADHVGVAGGRQPDGVADVPVLERARRDLLGDVDRARWPTSSGAGPSGS